MQGRMDLCFYDVWHDHHNAVDKIETHQSRQHVFSLLLSNFLCGLWVWWSVNGPQPVGLSYSLPFLFLADRTTPVWSSAAVDHLCKGLMCCAFRDGILQFLVVKSGYFIYCCFSINWNHSSYFDLSKLTRHFCPHNCRCLDIFSSLGHSCVNPRDDCASESQLFPKYSDQPAWHQQPRDIESHLNRFSSPFCCSVCTSAMSWPRLHA